MVSSVLELIIVCGRCHRDGSNGLIIDCHKLNGGIVRGLMDRLLIATSKMVTL